MDKSSHILDLTDAWIEWKNTCCVSQCSETNQDALIKVATGCVKKALAHLNHNQYTYWKDILDSPHNNAMTELEAILYNKETIKGKPFKNYLFEDITQTQNGNIGKALTGYLLNGILMHEFWKSVSIDYAQESTSDDTNPNQPEDRMTALNAEDTNHPISAYNGFDETETRSLTGKTEAFLKGIDKDFIIAWYCMYLNLSPSSPYLSTLFRRKKSALLNGLKAATNSLDSFCLTLINQEGLEYSLLNDLRRDIIIPTVLKYGNELLMQKEPDNEAIIWIRSHAK